MAVADTATPTLDLLELQQEIADEAARTDIECKAQSVVSTYGKPVYDVTAAESFYTDSELEAASIADVKRAVRYLDLRQLLVRPFHGQPQYVSFE